MMSQLLMRRSAAAIASSLGDAWSAASPPLARVAGVIAQQLMRGPRSERTAATACSSSFHTAAPLMRPATSAFLLLPEAAGPTPGSGTTASSSRSPAAAVAACLAALTGIWHIASPSCAQAETQQKVWVSHFTLPEAAGPTLHTS